MKIVVPLMKLTSIIVGICTIAATSSPSNWFNFDTVPVSCRGQYDVDRTGIELANNTAEAGPEDFASVECGFPDLRAPAEFVVRDDIAGGHIRAGVAQIRHDPGPVEVRYDVQGSIHYKSEASWGEIFMAQGGKDLSVFVGWEHACNKRLRKCEEHVHGVRVEADTFVNEPVAVRPVSNQGAMLASAGEVVYVDEFGHTLDLNRNTDEEIIAIGEAEDGLIVQYQGNKFGYLEYELSEQEFRWRTQFESIPSFSRFAYARDNIWVLTAQLEVYKYTDNEIVGYPYAFSDEDGVPVLRAGPSGAWIAQVSNQRAYPETDLSHLPGNCTAAKLEVRLWGLDTSESWNLELPAGGQYWLEGTFEQPEVLVASRDCAGLSKVERIGLYPGDVTATVSKRSGEVLYWNQGGLEVRDNPYHSEPDIMMLRFGRSSIWWDARGAVVMDHLQSQPTWNEVE